MEAELVCRAGVPFEAIPAGGVHGVGLLRAVRNAWRLVLGFFVSMGLLRRQKPAAVLTTGGYVSVPVALAAWLKGIPVLLFLPDIEPGFSVRWVSRLAKKVAVSVEDSRKFFAPDKVVTTGYPLREDLQRWNREEAREDLGLAAEHRVLLVFGGSRGARSINEAIWANLEALLDLAQVVHVTGTSDWERVSSIVEALPQVLRGRYHPFSYLHEEMGAALAAADLVLSRAGASVLGEFPFFGLPAILVPYPYAWRYQKVNADWLARQSAALVIPDEDLSTKVVSLVAEVLQAPERRIAMSASARALARPNAAKHIAEILLSMGQGA